MATLWEIKPLLATLHHPLQLLPFVYSEKVFYDTRSPRQLQLMIYNQCRIFVLRACGEGGVGGVVKEQEPALPSRVKCAINRSVGMRSIMGRAEREGTKIEGSAATGRKTPRAKRERRWK